MPPDSPNDEDETTLLRRVSEIRADRAEAKRSSAWTAVSAMQRSENQVLRELRELRAARIREAPPPPATDAELLRALVGAVADLPAEAQRALAAELGRLGVR
jgi:hypothetical protein